IRCRSTQERFRDNRRSTIIAPNPQICHFCIGAKTSSNSKLVTPERLILYTRSLCSSATMMLSMPHVDLSFRHTTIRKGGQTASISLTGVFSVQISRRFRRSGNQKQRIAIFDTRAPAYAMHVFRDSHRLLLGLDSHNNQIFLRGQRQGARRLSLGLHPTGQQQSHAVAQKTYVHRRPLADPSLVS